jgi:type II secretory pathway pseudopilin PulG
MIGFSGECPLIWSRAEVGRRTSARKFEERAFLSRRRRLCYWRAFTLVEVLLVLSLIVVFGAIAWPALRYSLASQRLRSAADQIRVEFTRARLAAIKDQIPYLFRYVPGESTYSLQPAGESAVGGFVASGAWDVAGGGSGPRAAGTSALIQEKSLPEGVIFIAGSSQSDFRSEAVLEEWVSISGESALAWSNPIIFFPEGTATDAELTLGNDQGRQISVFLRGITGTVQVGTIVRTEGFVEN